MVYHLDPFNDIVGIHFPDVEYILVATALTGEGGTTEFGSFGIYSGAGVPITAGENYHADYLVSVEIDWRPDFATVNWGIGTRYSAAGSNLGGGVQNLLTVTGPSFPQDVACSNDFAYHSPFYGGGSGGATNRWAAMTGELVNPPGDISQLFRLGTPTIEIVAQPFVGAEDEYNPAYPTAQTDFPRSRPALPSSESTDAVAGTVALSPTSVTYDGIAFDVIGALVVSPSVADSAIIFLCQRQGA
jgi:hypothetical protein